MNSLESPIKLDIKPNILHVIKDQKKVITKNSNLISTLFNE